MGLFSRDSSQVLLWSILLMVWSLILFPSRLGFSIGTGFFVYIIFEVGYYALVFYLLHLGSSWLDIFRGAGLTLVYRVALGSVFGVIVAILYSMNLSVAVTLGISRYFPAILMQVLVAPFVTRALFASKSEGSRTRSRRPVSAYRPAIAPDKEITQPFVRPARPERAVSSNNKVPESKPDTSVSHDTNGFERAVRYLGEHHAVILAAVIDHEGLTMATFRRGEVDPDEWAPLSLMLQEANAGLLRCGRDDGGPVRIDLVFGQKKLTVTRVEQFNLLILSNQEVDDLLGIRITQAIEIVKRFISERYGRSLSSRPEEKYVSNT
ncbi:MAG: hypothetical protein JSV44_06425 [Candidatus Zixiibacteriota bacterium]|nr:MAG: hypothetical protein JSV44_06425 [candidate division Zixibacteria bacterium]